MYAIWGSLLVAGGVLAMALLSLLVRNPASPSWARNDMTAQLGAVLIAGALGFGIAWLAMAPMQLAAEGVSLAWLALAAATVVGVGIVLRLLGLGTRLRAYEAATAAPTLAVSNPEPLPPRTPRPRSGGRSRRAA